MCDACASHDILRACHCSVQMQVRSACALPRMLCAVLDTSDGSPKLRRIQHELRPLLGEPAALVHAAAAMEDRESARVLVLSIAALSAQQQQLHCVPASGFHPKQRHAVLAVRLLTAACFCERSAEAATRRQLCTCCPARTTVHTDPCTATHAQQLPPGRRQGAEDTAGGHAEPPSHPLPAIIICRGLSSVLAQC